MIILSTVVTQPSSFASDGRRLNVALTRAKRHLFLVGSAPALERSAPAFADAVRRCRSSGSSGGSFWPDGRLLLPLAAVSGDNVGPAGGAAAHAVPGAAAGVSGSGGGLASGAAAHSPAAAARSAGPAAGQQTGTQAEPGCEAACSSLPLTTEAEELSLGAASVAASHDDLPVATPSRMAATPGALALSVADADPDVPCFDLLDFC